MEKSSIKLFMDCIFSKFDAINKCIYNLFWKYCFLLLVINKFRRVHRWSNTIKMEYLIKTII